MDIAKTCSMDQEGIITNLKEGLKAEHKAKEVCEDIYQLLEDEDDKVKIKKIIDDEIKHIKITENLIETVEKFYFKK